MFVWVFVKVCCWDEIFFIANGFNCMAFYLESGVLDTIAFAEEVIYVVDELLSCCD